MKTIVAKVIGDNDLLAIIELQDPQTGHSETKSNVKLAEFSVVEGKKYVMHFIIEGTSGQKYKIQILGATKATYPDGEFTSTGRDILGARITG